MNLDGLEEWVPKNMAFDNSDVKLMNLTQTILSLSHNGTADSDTNGFWVALNGSVVLVYGLSVVLVCGLSVVLVHVWVISDGGSRRNIDSRIVRDLG